MSNIMRTLQESLLAPEVRPSVVADCQTLIEEEVADKSGISGTATKMAYKTVKTLASSIIPDAVNDLLPDFVAQLEPFWVEFNGTDESDFGKFLDARGEKVSAALLSVTDARAQKSDRAVIKKAYNTIRSSGVKSIEAALPRLGALIQKYAA
jgi:hypothetical protein